MGTRLVFAFLLLGRGWTSIATPEGVTAAAAFALALYALEIGLGDRALRRLVAHGAAAGADQAPGARTWLQSVGRRVDATAIAATPNSNLRRRCSCRDP